MRRGNAMVRFAVIASEAKQSMARHHEGIDLFVASASRNDEVEMVSADLKFGIRLRPTRTKMVDAQGIEPWTSPV
jgi:hypothetical protein